MWSPVTREADYRAGLRGIQAAIHSRHHRSPVFARPLWREARREVGVIERHREKQEPIQGSSLCAVVRARPTVVDGGPVLNRGPVRFEGWRVHPSSGSVGAARGAGGQRGFAIAGVNAAVARPVSFDASLRRAGRSGVHAGGGVLAK